MSLQTIRFDELPIVAGDRVLDLGCGEGRHAILAYLEADAHVYALDLSAADLKTAADRFEAHHDPERADRTLSFLRGSGLQLPFRDASFEKVICSEVLEHIDDYERVLDEIARVTKPGGLVALSVPRYGPEWVCWKLSSAYHEVLGGHVRIFRERELTDAAEARSWHRTGRHWAHALHVPYWWLRCMFWERGEDAPLPRAYHKLLVWDLMKAPKITRWLDRVLNPLMGKSVVMYFVRGVS